MFFVKFCATFGADTKFDKAMLSVMIHDKNPPSERDMKIIMDAFSGNDPTMKPELAFGSLLKQLRLRNTDPEHWQTIIKSLILLNRDVDLNHIENRQECRTYQSMLIDQLIQTFYKFIKRKAFLIQSNNFYTTEDKLLYFIGLKNNEIFEQLNQLIELANIGLEVSDTWTHGHLKFQINQFVFLLVMKDLILCHNSASIALSQLLLGLQHMCIDELHNFQLLCHPLQQFSQRLELFLDNCKFIEGFEFIQLNDRISPELYNYISQYTGFVIQNELYSKNHSIHEPQQLVVEVIPRISYFTQRQTEKRKSTYIRDPSQAQFKQEPDSSFDLVFFNSIQNNYSTNYTPIDVQFKQRSVVSIFKTDPILNARYESIKESIEIKQSIFIESIFEQFKNQYNI
ncbi:hypothetical protein pb186bvf_015727 [Paramecium bursaria]